MQTKFQFPSGYISESSAWISSGKMNTELKHFTISYDCDCTIAISGFYPSNFNLNLELTSSI